MSDNYSVKRLGQGFIYYLKWSDKLPAAYFKLSSQLSHYGIKLVPVTFKEYERIRRTRGDHLLSITTQLVDKRYYNFYRRKFIDVAMMNGGLNFYDINSYGQELAFNRPWKQKRHHLYLLPARCGDIAREIARSYFGEAKEVEKWPGGRRPLLSKLVVANED